MAEFIGQGYHQSLPSRISLISKRDIRYVGILHEISSENSTVALEQVVSFGTEGRRPDDEVVPSDNVYEYIVFRGSDVKDLRIEENPKENKPPQPPQVPDDPAILGSARRPGPSAASQAAPLASQQPQPQAQTQSQQVQQPQQSGQDQQRQGPLPRFQQQPPFPYYYPPPNQRFGPQGFPPGPGFPGMPYGAPPPGWYPPPGQSFPHPPPGQFYPPPSHQQPIGPVSQSSNQPGPQSQPPVPTGQLSNNSQETASQTQSPVKPIATVKLPSTANTPTPPTTARNGPPPPTESKPDVAAALAPPVPATVQEIPAVPKLAPTGPKSGRIMPAVPRLSPAAKPLVPVNGNLQSRPPNGFPPPQPPARQAATRPSSVPTKTLEDANRDARAAVAAAMAKLPPAPGQKKQVDGESVVDNLTKKVNDMRTKDHIRTSRPGTGGYAAGHRGGRGGFRAGRPQVEGHTKKMEVPSTDYDFATANAKFNKQDLVKEAIATGSPITSPVEGDSSNNELPAGTSTNGARPVSEQSAALPGAAGYNKTSSFFDNISSESKDRDDVGGKRLGGREFRSEEQKKNLETFGQGSVDNGYRGGFRGRGRGRGGFGQRGRGGFGGRVERGGRGSARGGRGALTAEG